MTKISDSKLAPLLPLLDADLPEVREAGLFTLPGNVPPWTATGIRVAKGEHLSLLATGRIVTVEALHLWLGPSLALWGRIGDGRIFNPPRDTLSLCADRDGELDLAIYNGEWATPQGELATPIEAYAAVGGALEVLAIRWQGTAEDGLAALQRRAPQDPLVAAELRRLREPRRMPDGWHHLWFLGDSEIFSAERSNGSRVIRARTHDDVAILQRPVDFPLGPDTRFSWRWRVSELPARQAENAPHLHDYLSIALEFDNGLDLTWYWSAELPVGTHYACPLPTWAARETHMVLRSGPQGLGEWHAEERAALADYERCIGAPPRRIVGVWLIAVSVFGHRRGEAEFADIELHDARRSLRI